MKGENCSSVAGIRVVCKRNGECIPVCLAGLRTTFNEIYWSDNLGYVYLDNYEMIKWGTVFVYVCCDGFEKLEDGLGFHGMQVKLNEGEITEIVIQERFLAQRRYRTTGLGRYHHYNRLITHKMIPDANIISSFFIAGQDSVQSVCFEGKHWWFWGDTVPIDYPVSKSGFRSVGAHSNRNRDPNQPIQYNYLLDETNSFVRSTFDSAKFIEIEQIEDNCIQSVWLSGVTTVSDSGNESMVAHALVNLSNDQFIVGAVQWNTAKCLFTWKSALIRSTEETDFTKLWKDMNGAIAVQKEGIHFDKKIYFTTPLPVAYVEATIESWCNPQAYKRTDIQITKIQWISLDETYNGIEILPHRGSIRWNKYIQKYIMIFGTKRWDESSKQFLSTNLGGHVFYSEAECLYGPWDKAIQITNHEETGMTFYNINHHSHLDQNSTIFFEGTFTTLFAPSAVHPVPLYDYNNLMYSLDINNNQIKQVFR